MRIGAAFLNLRRPELRIPQHLWVVISDPCASAVQVVLVNVTSNADAEFFEDTCVLEPGDHPFISKRSYIAYSMARQTTVELLDEGVRQGLLKPNEPISESLLARILDGAGRSANFPANLLSVLSA